MTKTKLFLIGGLAALLPAVAYAADCCGVGAACCALFPHCPFC